jgi:hypothetical protein
LLPTPEQVKKLSLPKLIDLRQHQWRLQAEIERDPAKFFHPNSGGQDEYMRFDNPNKRGRYFFAGNKTGKTTGTCIIVAEFMCGRQLWGTEPGERPAHAYRLPCRGVYYTEDFASHEETIIPTYLTWLPKGEILSIIRSQSGNVSHIVHKNGSILYFRTYDQGYEKAEGKDYDIAACDEPPPRELYTAIFRGLVALGGLFYIAATLLKEAWLYDELAHGFNQGFQGEIYDNPWLDTKARDDFVATLDETEKAVRIHGKPISLTGLIYPEFRDAAPTVIKSINPEYPSELQADDVPWDVYREEPYPIIMGVDPHERKPLHVEWAYVLPNDSVLWFDWALVPSGSFDEVFDFLEDKENHHRGRTQLTVMDPNRGAAKQAGDTCWMDQFEAHGYSVLLGNDDLSIGHSTTRDYLKTQRMRWTERCRGEKGPIYQMGRYAWDDWTGKKLRDKRASKESPQEKYKDFPDVHRYVAMANLTFDMLKHKNDAIRVAGERRAASFGRPRAY